MKFWYCCILLFTCSTWALAQPESPDEDRQPVRMTKNNADCIGAVMIRDTIFGPVISPPGVGHNLEIRDNELGDLYFFEREHNTVWYRFRPPYNAELTFEITPVIDEDDFDFLLFGPVSPAFCSKMKKQGVTPVRTNISRNNKAYKSRTGLSFEATQEYVPSGPGDPFSKSIKVKKGELYYLVVDNPYRENKGHTITLHYKRDFVPKEEKKEIKPKRVEKIQKMRLMIFDQDTDLPITADVSIEGVYPGTPLEEQKVHDYIFDIKSYRTYTVSCNKSGYMFYSNKIVPGKDSIMEVQIKLQQIKPGRKVSLKNIKFAPDLADILPISRPALEELLKFMNANPTVKIEIEGHVNGPNSPNKKKFQSLSKERAEAIYNHLVLHGVEKNRIKYKGYGNTQMIYTSPVTDGQSEANRRVEIRVTAY